MEKIALTISGTPIQGGEAPTGGTLSLEKIIQLGIGYLYLGAVMLALLFIAWGAFNWITSEGDKQKVKQAREKILFAIIGLIIAFIAFLIINIIGKFFDVNLIAPYG